MKEKLLALMQNEGLKPSQLAEILEVNPAGISHIISGRNKPGFDLLQKILRRFPRVNPDWLLLDAPNIYRDTTSDTTGISDGTTGVKTHEVGEPQPVAPSDLFTPSADSGSRSQHKSGNRAARIVIIFENGTFQSFDPADR